MRVIKNRIPEFRATAKERLMEEYPDFFTAENAQPDGEYNPFAAQIGVEPFEDTP